MAAGFNQTGHEAIASTASATALTIPSGAGKMPATHAIIQVGAAGSVRWRADGTSPTTTVGILATASSTIEFMDAGGDYTGVLAKIKIISVSADTALSVAYFSS